MIKENQLTEYMDSVRIKNGEGITLENIRAYLNKLCQSRDIPIAFQNDTIKSGGLLNKDTYPCLVVYHPDHEKDYFKFAIQIKTQGTYAFIYFYSFGQSKQYKTLSKINMYKQQRSQSNDIGDIAKSLIKEGITNLGRNKQKFAEEKNYYSCISDIFNDLFE